MADSMGQDIQQHSFAQLFLIRKDPEVAALNRHRMLVFEDEIMKRRDSIHEARVNKVLTKLGLLEEEQYGFTQNADMGTAIYTVASAIEDARIRDKEIWIEFKDQEKAFDTLEDFQGKVMACMVLGIPMKVAKKWLRFDTSMILEIIQEYGTTAETLGFHEGTFTPQCGGLQGGPRSPGMWKRFYNMLIKAQKLVEKGKLAEIEGEEGTITLTSTVAADDTANMGGDNLNIQCRAETAQEFITYAGCHTNAGKSYLGALIKDIDGALRSPTEEENIFYTRMDTGIREGCQILNPTDRVRYLGWFTAMSDEVDESQKQAEEEVEGRMRKIANKKCSGAELKKFVQIAEVPRILYRYRFSNTGQEGIDRTQKQYNRVYRAKGHINKALPNEVLWMDTERGGLGWVNLWDEISIDRTVTWIKHANADGVEAKIASSAVHRSEGLTKSGTPIMEGNYVRPWDGTMLGRIMEWMTSEVGKHFQIEGGNTYQGYKEFDVAIADCLPSSAKRIATMEAKIIVEGCRRSGIHWVSQMVTDDGNTWVSGLQNDGEFNNEGKFEWVNKTYTKGERTYVKHRNKWNLWASKVKRIAVSIMSAKRSDAGEQRDHGRGTEEEREAKYNLRMEDLLGAYWADQSIDLKSMDVVFCNGELEPRIVVSQEEGMVTTLKTVDSQDAENTVNYVMHGHRIPGRIAWNEDEYDETPAEMKAIAATEGRMPGATLFKGGGSKLGSTVWMVCDEEMEVVPRSQLCRAAGELFEKRWHSKFNKPQIGDLHDGKHGKLSSGFLRVYEHPMSTGRRARTSLQRSFRSGKPETTFNVYDTEIAGEGNGEAAVAMDGPDMDSQIEQWRQKAASMGGSAGILAGGDGSAKKKKGVINGAYGWGVYGIGETTVEYWEKKKADDVTIMCSGGNVDWAMEAARSNTRAEQTHILAAMIQLFPVGLDVLYAVDYTGAISNFNESQFWTSTQWINCENRDVMEGIVFMKKKYKTAGMKFECFHNRGHPERWSPREPAEYTALEKVAVMSDEIAERVGLNVIEPQEVPYIPGRKRWTVSYRGEEIVKPLRRQMKKFAKIRHNEIYCAETRGGELEAAAKETNWDAIATCRSTYTEGIGSNYAVARQSYHWLMTNHAMVKKGILADSDGAADCSCNDLETQWHVMGMGSCNSYPIIRKRFSRMREEMMDKIGIPSGVKEAIMANHEPNEDGVYPDWADPKYVFKFREMKIVSLFESHRNAAIHWFQNGHPMKSWITDCEELLGVNEKMAEKFSKEWYSIKRQETAALWAQRQNIFKEDEIPMTQLREQLAEVLKAKRARKSKTKTNEKYLKMSRKQLENFLEQEKRTNLVGSITRFVIEPDASDEEKGQAKREKHIAKMERNKRRNAQKQKVRRKAKAKRKANDEQEMVHIDDMLNDDSKEARRGGKKERRKARHRATAVMGKAKKKADKQQTADKKAAEREWESGGKNAMTNWLHGFDGSSSSSNTSSSSSGSKSTSNDFDDPRLWATTKWVKELISKRGNRKENPDRDKSDKN